jgi:hypothetical protein
MVLETARLGISASRHPAARGIAGDSVRRSNALRLLVAVAEKLSALRTEEFFRERRERGNVAKAKRLLKRAGRGNPPAPGDEVD